MNENKLTKEEQLFCELYATGDAPFAGNPTRCYIEVFHCNDKRVKHKALQLLSQNRIQSYLEELDKLTYEESKYMKKFLTQNLMNIVTECSEGVYRDRRGTTLSPAPLRSVAVNASKALMDMYPVKDTQDKNNHDGENENGIVFNVIMPSSPNEEPKIDSEN